MKTSNYEVIKTAQHLPAIIHVIKAEELARLATFNESIPAHWHRSIELSLVEEGREILFINGEEQIIHNDFTLINSGTVHEIRKYKEELPTVILVIIAYDYLTKIMDNVEDHVFNIHKSESAKIKLRVIFHHLVELHQSKDPYAFLLIQNSINEIMYILLSECLEPSQSKVYMSSQKHQKITREMITYINEHYSEDLSLDQIADHFAMSKEYFSRIFHQRMGLTFRSYLKQIRLHQAFQELNASDKTIKELSMYHGFPNVKSFIDAFKSTYQMTPQQYRKQSQNMTITS